MNLLLLFDIGRKALTSLRLRAVEGDMAEVLFSFNSSTISLRFVMRRTRWRVFFRKKTDIKPRFTIHLDPLHSRTFYPYDEKNCLYSSEEVCICTSDTVLTSHIHLTKETQLQALAHARKTGEKVLAGEYDYKERAFAEGMNRHVEVCVAFWKDGKIRGSMMEQGETLEEAIERATARALIIDERWKPVSSKDFADLQIEITVFSPVKLQVDPGRIQHIDYTKGYIANGPRSFGLYVPEVFNARKFFNAYEFFSSLALVKGDVKKNELGNVKYLAFDVFDFIESDHREDSIELYGGMPRPELFSTESIGPLMNETAVHANEWLSLMQEDDGNIIPVVQIFEKGFKQFDVVRLSFAIYAIAEWQKYKPTEIGQEQLNIAVKYTAKILARADGTRISEHTLYGLVYLAHTYCSVGEFEKANEVVLRVLPTIYDFNFSPILFLQLLTLLERLKEVGIQEHEVDKERIGRQCRNEFEHQRNSPYTDAASWAEAVVAFSYSDPKFSHTVAKWLIAHQMHNGAFRQSMMNSYTYTRGTSKIFEVLALYPEEYKEEVAKSCAWVVSMQYTPQNTFFVQPNFRLWVFGGFRHDYCNADLWSDTASHYIFGVSRYLRVRGYSR